MPVPQAFRQYWRKQPIKTKLAFASGILVALIVLVALTGYIAQETQYRLTETAIENSMRVQQLVLEMKAELQHARRLGRDFFLRWPTMGYEQAYDTYARGNDQRIKNVVALSAELRTLIADSNVSDALRDSHVNLNFYLSAADRYAATFEEAVGLVTKLAAADSGAQSQLAQTSTLLLGILEQSNNPSLLLLYREMQVHEKDYLVSRQRPSMQMAFNAAVPLRNAITTSIRLRPAQRRQAIAHLTTHRFIADEILQLDVDINSRLNEFDLQAEAVDPISDELVRLAGEETQRTRDQIADNSRLAVLVLIGTVIGAVILAGSIVRLQNEHITRNIIELSDMAGELQQGNLKARADIDSVDEFGRLAGTFNGMATELDTLINKLEERVAERTAQLAQANEEISALNAQLEQENLRMSAELDITRRLQQMILPTEEELQAVNGLDIAGYMEPADEVGGDYYDVLQENGNIKISIGDVTDHGLESGVVMLMAQAAVRALMNSGEVDPVRFMNALNHTIYKNVQRMSTDRNLTLSLIDYKPGEMRLSGQHEDVIVVRRDGTVELIDTMNLGFPIGLLDDIAGMVDQKTIRLQDGDGVVLYTDGITEAENNAGDFYSLERLCEVIGTHWSQSADSIKESVIADIRQHIGDHRVYDDITLLIIKQQATPEEA